MAWTNIPDTAVGVGGLPSGTTMTALRDNTLAQLGRSLQTWQDVTGSRVQNTVYQNTTDLPIMVVVSDDDSSSRFLQVSSDNVTFITTGEVSRSGSIDPISTGAIVPDGHYYKFTGTPTRWVELRE